MQIGARHVPPHPSPLPWGEGESQDSFSCQWAFSASMVKPRFGEISLGQNSASFVEEDAFEIHFEGLRIGGFVHSLLFGDFSSADELE
jgi:hypothetical protein